MAEYYPLLAKAVGSLPNSTLETRRVVYERARKALIGQLRTLHPPVADEDIERESTELDRAVQKLESELAKGIVPPPPKPIGQPKPAPTQTTPPSKPLSPPKPPAPRPAPAKLAPIPPPGPPKSSTATDTPAPLPVRPAPTRPAPVVSTSKAPAPAPQSAAAEAKTLATPTPSATRPKPPPSILKPTAPPAKPPVAKTSAPGTTNAAEPVSASVSPLTKPSATSIKTKPPTPKAPPPDSPLSVRSAGSDLQADGVAAPAVASPPKAGAASPPPLVPVAGPPVASPPPGPPLAIVPLDGEPAGKTTTGEATVRPRLDGQRPIAPQIPSSAASRRKTWIVPAGIGVIVVIVAAAAYALRDTRQTVAKNKPVEQTTKTESGKIAERVGGTGSQSTTDIERTRGPANTPSNAATGTITEAPVSATSSPSLANPEIPVAQRAALLVEAPDEPNKVKTFLGTVVWKLNNVNEGPGDNVSLAVEADVDLPDDKMKATLTFERNTDASLPASHTIKVRFAMLPGSVTGDVQQISVPQLRQEDSPSGEALAGVTVPVVQNSFLIGLSPGNAETVNIKQIREMQWIDVPIMLSNGKIAKLTFEKGVSGTRDLNEAITAWQKS